LFCFVLFNFISFVLFCKRVNGLTSITYSEEAIESGGTVLVHCAEGISRSAAIVIAYLMKKHRWSFGEANSFVQSRRKCVSTKFSHQLILWHTIEYNLDGTTISHEEVRKNYKPSKFTQNPKKNTPIPNPLN
jgi:hypothetical protein